MPDTPPFRLDGRTALVTGAARGIGRAACVALARAGAAIVGADIAAPAHDGYGVAASTPADLDETGRLVQATGRPWRALVFDQRDGPAVARAAAEVRAAGGLDILFANAGVQGFGAFLEMPEQDWQAQIDINVLGTARVLRAFAPLLVERGRGRIIVTSSTQGRHGTKTGSAYSTSKWALIGLAKSLATELGAHGVTVNTLIPGLIDTPLTRHEERYAQAITVAGKTPTGDEAKDEATAREALAAKSPLNVPWIDPDDIAPVVVFLASDEARMVTGASYEVTAGDSANLP